jgi:hypothetical protein
MAADEATDIGLAVVEADTGDPLPITAAGSARRLRAAPPTDPDVRNYRIRLVRSTIHTHWSPSATLRLRPQALLSVVIALTWDRVSTYPPCFPPTVG